MGKFKILLMMLFVFLFSVGVVNAEILSSGKSYTLTPLPDSSWPGTDSNLTKLTDSDFGRSAGVGWTSKPVIVLDLGDIYPISNVSIYFYDGTDSYFAPAYISVEFSSDGVNFVNVGNISSWSNYITYGPGVSVLLGSIASSDNGRYVRYSPVGGYNSNFCSTEIMVEGVSTPVVSTPVTTPTSPPATPTPTLPPATPTPTLPPATPTPQATPAGSVAVSFGGVVYGRIVDKFKSPLPEIKVEYSTLGDEYLGKNPVLTDNDGYYYFEDVDTQFGYGLVMTGKRYGTITLNYEGTAKDSVVRVPDEMIIRGNSDKFTLSGTVKDLYSSPVEHARVRVKSSGDPRIVYTDSLGAFSVSDLFIGTYTVTVKHSGYYVGRVKYFNTDGLDGSVEVPLQEK